ncbi:MAG: hypothetical protein ABGZ35_01540 [Planctomycetaceae bacterium]|jgi:hypothetical protein
MKKFRSRLQSLYRLRDQQEQLARAHVATCQQQNRNAEQKTDNLKQLVNAASAAMNVLFSRHTGAETVNAARALFISQQDQLQAAVAQQQAATANLQQALKEWHAARAELKATGHRIENQRAAHRRDTFLKEEQNQQETAARAIFQQASDTGGATRS